MKKAIIRLTIFITASSLWGCSKSEPSPAEKLIGEWDLVKYEPPVKSVAIGTETVTVYIKFNTDGTFKMDQTVGAGRAATFDGTYTINGDQLSGVYSDKSKWGASYTITFPDDRTLVMITTEKSESYTYNRL